MTDLRHELSRHQTIRQQLLDQWPQLLDDPETLADTAEGLGSDLPAVIASHIRSALEDEAEADGECAYIASRMTRLKHLRDRAKRKRARAEWAMIEAGIPKISGYPGFAHARIAPGMTAVHIEDETKIPDALCKIERTPKKKEIRAKLDANEEVPGATLLKNPVPYLVVYPK